MSKKLRKEGFNMGRYRVRNLMKSLGLKLTFRTPITQLAEFADI
jgi:putative transposase